MSVYVEKQTEWIINNTLVNNGWIIDSVPGKNVFFQKAKPEHQAKLEVFSKKRGYKKPDYILYKDSTPIGIIEAKSGGKSLKEALKQATEYAKLLGTPLIFASNGAYVETQHLIKESPLFINGEEVSRIVKYKEAVSFIENGDNAIYTIPQELIKSKEDLIQIFKKVNNLLRKANIFSGYDRISEFSSILFLKLISEQNVEKSWWDSIKKQDDNFLLSYINGTVIRELENKYGGGVFNEINIKKPSLFKQIAEMLDPLFLSDIKTDIKGDAFEYFLKNMNQADNDLGQYFTPRHIVKAMVHLVNPKFKETIYDPFCGTGGFLIESFNYIKENSIIETEEENKTLKYKTLFGRDATKVSTIAKKNMILHGDGHSNIEEIDSLENPFTKKAKIILTNIPFSLKDIDYTNLYYNGLGKKNGDAICVLHCLDALEEGGRMALVVPEGFLFKKSLIQVRKFLLSKANLELIVSLPQGVFQPYTGVKTDILYLTNAHKPEYRDGYYYFEVKNDGFSLDAHRRKLQGENDIYTLESNNLAKTEKEILKNAGFKFIHFSKITDNNYNFVGNIYTQSLINNTNIEFMKLKEVATLLRGVSFGKNDYLTEHRKNYIGIVTTKTAQSNGINRDDLIYIPIEKVKKEKLLKSNDILISISNSLDKVGRTTFVENYHTQLSFGAFMAVIRVNQQSKVLPKYLFYILNSNKVKNYYKENANTTTNISNLTFEILENMSIPIKSFEEQNNIVEELESYYNIINSSKNIIKNWKPYLKTNLKWQKIKLGEICTLYQGFAINSKTKHALVKDGDMPLLRIKDLLNNNYEQKVDSKLVPRNTIVNKDDLLYTRTGQIGLVFTGREGVLHNNSFKIAFDKTKITKNYLYNLLTSAFIKNRIIEMSTRSAQPDITHDMFKNMEILLPPLKIQNEITKDIENQRSLINYNKELINIFENKIQDTLNSIWLSDDKNTILA